MTDRYSNISDLLSNSSVNGWCFAALRSFAASVQIVANTLRELTPKLFFVSSGTFGQCRVSEVMLAQTRAFSVVAKW